MFDEMFWVSVAFLVFVIAAWRPAVSAIRGVLLSHSTDITHDLRESERMHKEALERLAALTKEMEAMLLQAESIIDNAKEDANALLTEAGKEAERISNKRSEIAMQRIAQYEESLLNQIRNDIINMSVAAVEQKLGEGLEKSIQLKLMEDDLDDIKKVIN
ncbi:MAG: hypothetical protein JSS50_00985 [Proteobacteria bacterium]|nr:hypothetical protein [Pseudomonadota bacterium]